MNITRRDARNELIFLLVIGAICIAVDVVTFMIGLGNQIWPTVLLAYVSDQAFKRWKLLRNPPDGLIAGERTRHARKEKASTRRDTRNELIILLVVAGVCITLFGLLLFSDQPKAVSGVPIFFLVGISIAVCRRWTLLKTQNKY